MKEANQSESSWDLTTRIMALAAIPTAIAAIVATCAWWDERGARIAAEATLEQYSEQSYQVAFGNDWDLILDARPDAYNPSSVTLTPIFDTPFRSGMDASTGEPYLYRHDQIKIVETHDSNRKQAILPQVREDICARPENIDRCPVENIRTVRVQVKFPSGRGFTTEVPAPS